MDKQTKFPLPEPETLLEIIKKQKKPLRLDALMNILGLKRALKQELEKVLRALEHDGALARMPGGKWAIPERLKSSVGQFLAKSDGGGIVRTDGGGEIFIHPLQKGDALHKDMVRVLILPGGNGATGKIVEVLEKGQKEIAARVEKREGKLIICRPADRKLAIRLSVDMEDFPSLGKKIKPGALVLLKPERHLAQNLWAASLLNIFGSENKIEVQEAIVKCNHNAPDAFPALAISQAEALDRQPLQADDREDWRHLSFVTIDGRDARDFDDAIHVEKAPGGFILRVAIADVSHYVKPDSRQDSLDKEALKRGNSWYFPRSVEPMLPKILSNGLCSLRPGEDRLAMMAEIAFSSDGLPLKSRFAPIIMRSQGRLVYEDVAEFFARQKPLPDVDNSIIEPMLGDAFRLYRLLALQRRKRGTLDFDLPEPAYKFDKNGNLASMGIADRTDANCLIEEFMIAANEAVARFIGNAKKPFLYRVHPAPEQQKLAALYETLILTGVEPANRLPQNTYAAQPGDIQKILMDAAGKPQEYTVNRLCLRAMQQARYQTENTGHFGLASVAYCHFTSPIRRYADLLTHRALKVCIGMEKGGLPDVEALDAIGDSLNKLEREAMECEREIARRLGCLAISDKIGEVISGIVSGVTDFGIFVEFKEIPAEGLARITDLGNDWYEYDQKRQQLVGQRTGQIWRLGQPVEMRIENVDTDRLEIRLVPIETPKANGRKTHFNQKNRGKTKSAPHKKSTGNDVAKSAKQGAGKPKRTKHPARGKK